MVVVPETATEVAPVPMAALADADACTVTVPVAPGMHCASPVWLIVAIEAAPEPIKVHPPG